MGTLGRNSICEKILKYRAYFAVIFLQFGYSGSYIIIAICLKQGMNHFILSFYRLILATFVIAPFALIFERNSRPKMTFSIFWKLVLLGFLEPVLDQNLYYMALKYTTATYVSVLANSLPAITFIMAILFRVTYVAFNKKNCTLLGLIVPYLSLVTEPGFRLRLEKVHIREVYGQAKIIGTILAIGGATIMALYKGPVINLFGTHVTTKHAIITGVAISDAHWIIGTLFGFGSGFAWSGFFIVQTYTVKEYPAELSLTAWTCFMGAIEAGIVSLVMVRDKIDWALGWDSSLLAVVYTGVVCSGIAYYLQSVVNGDKGPVFLSVFSPLGIIITTGFSFFIFHELPHLGRLIGAIVIVLGVYALVWGKSKDNPTPITQSEKAKLQELPIVYDNTKNSVTDKPNGKTTSDHDEFPSGKSAIKLPSTQQAKNQTTMT